MTAQRTTNGRLTFRPLTTDTWGDFETLFGERGACGGCWCMNWRISRSEFECNKGRKNKQAMRRLVNKRTQLGILAYDGKIPVGWCAVAPREHYIRLAGSRVLKPVDENRVWSISCFFIAKQYRQKGFSSEILNGVIAICRKRKVTVIEAYPVIPYTTNMPAAFAWTGFLSAFIKAGFVEVARRSPSRPIVRFFL